MNFPTPRLNELISSNEGIASIWGDFGIGKTTFALQTAIYTAKQDKEVLYIYSKPNFPSKRLGSLLKEESPDLLKNIKFIRITDFNELITLIFNLEFLILNNLKEKSKSLNLIIIDSLTDLYRLGLNSDKKEKNVNLNYQLNQILATLYYLLETYGTEILIINELSRKYIDDTVVATQSGGNPMNFWITNSIKIERTDILNIRKIIIKKVRENKIFEFSAELTKNGFE